MHIYKGHCQRNRKENVRSEVIEILYVLLFSFLCYSFSMNNSTCSHQNLNVKHVATLFEEVQNRYVNKLISIDEKHITIDERHKVNK